MNIDLKYILNKTVELININFRKLFFGYYL